MTNIQVCRSRSLLIFQIISIASSSYNPQALATPLPQDPPLPPPHSIIPCSREHSIHFPPLKNNSKNVPPQNLHLQQLRPYNPESNSLRQNLRSSIQCLRSETVVRYITPTLENRAQNLSSSHLVTSEPPTMQRISVPGDCYPCVREARDAARRAEERDYSRRASVG